MREFGPAKWALGDYCWLTKQTPSGRIVAGFTKMMDNRFKRASGDMVLANLAQWNDFGRQKDEPIRAFWVRYDRLQSQLRNMSAEWPSRMQYAKVYYALDLSTDQRTLVNATMEACGKTGDIDELKRITIRVFDV